MARKVLETTMLHRACLALTLLTAYAASAEAGTYQLSVDKAVVRVDGRTVEKLAINGLIPGPTLRLKEGEDATITVANNTNEPTSVHWHGIMLPGMMDGAPGFNGFRGIQPGQSFTYTFRIRQSGTYWYHSHSGTQDQSVLGAIVIDPAEPPPVSADREYVVLLGDLTPENSDRVLRKLKADPGYYNYAKRTIFDFFRDAREQGLGATLRDRMAWGQMRMDPTDLADVTGFSFLVNGKAPEQNETLLFRRGERIRLRLINGSAMTFFDIRIPGLKLNVVAADGNDVEPVTVDELRMGIAERYDVIVEPAEDKPYTLFAESLDRTGYARATLATAMGQAGPIPERRPRTILTMADMGGIHAGHVAAPTAGQNATPPQVDHAAHAPPVDVARAAIDHSSHAAHGDIAAATGADHSGHAASGAAAPASVAADQSAHAAHVAPVGRADPHAAHTAAPDHAAHVAAPTAADHAGHVAALQGPQKRPLGWTAGFPEGVKVIDYSDLKARTANADTREPTRDIRVRLTGNMERYRWTLNEASFPEGQPVRVRYGERVRLIFANDTMMAHPMHLHGMFFEVENGESDLKPLKDTVIVPPGKSVSVTLTAKEVGAWPLHCHLLYHMVAGMMTSFVVTPPDVADAAVTPSGGTVEIVPGAHGAHGAGHH
jgi:CopA family copper-resistance protein